MQIPRMNMGLENLMTIPFPWLRMNRHSPGSLASDFSGMKSVTGSKPDVTSSKAAHTCANESHCFLLGSSKFYWNSLPRHSHSG